MTFEPTIVSLLVLGVIVAYAAGALLLALGRAAAGWTVFGAGFALGAAAFVFRWQEVGHVPFQNLYEVFLVMGVLMLPVSVCCRVLLGARLEAFDPLIGVVLLVPVAFGVFSPAPRPLPPALQSPLFVPHVAVYLLAYVVLGKAGIQALGCLFCRAMEGIGAGGAVGGVGGEGLRSVRFEQAAHRVVLAGFPLLTVGLILGAYWGRIAWDDYWHWDPKELWSLASWLVFVIYLHVRGMFGGRRRVVNSALVVLGVVFILITLLLANLSAALKGLHSYA